MPRRKRLAKTPISRTRITGPVVAFNGEVLSFTNVNELILWFAPLANTTNRMTRAAAGSDVVYLHPEVNGGSMTKRGPGRPKKLETGIQA